MFGFHGPLSACKPWFVMYFPCQIWRFSHLVCSPTKGLRQHHWLHPNSTSKQSGLNGKKRDLWSSGQSNQESWNAQQSHKHRKQMKTVHCNVVNVDGHTQSLESHLALLTDEQAAASFIILFKRQHQSVLQQALYAATIRISRDPQSPRWNLLPLCSADLAANPWYRCKADSIPFWVQRCLAEEPHCSLGEDKMRAHLARRLPREQCPQAPCRTADKQIGAARMVSSIATTERTPLNPNANKIPAPQTLAPYCSSRSVDSQQQLAQHGRTWSNKQKIQRLLHQPYWIVVARFFANDCHVSMKFHAHHRQVAATKLGRPFSEALKGEDPSCHLMAKKDVFPGIFLGLDLKGYEARCIPATHVSHLRWS